MPPRRTRPSSEKPTQPAKKAKTEHATTPTAVVASSSPDQGATAEAPQASEAAPATAAVDELASRKPVDTASSLEDAASDELQSLQSKLSALLKDLTKAQAEMEVLLEDRDSALEVAKSSRKDVRHRASLGLICGYMSWMSKDDSDYSVTKDSDVESRDKTEKSWDRKERKQKEKAAKYAFIPNEEPALQEKIKVITAKLDAKKRKIKKQYKVMKKTKKRRDELDEEIDELTGRHAGYWAKYNCHFDEDNSEGEW